MSDTAIVTEFCLYRRFENDVYTFKTNKVRVEITEEFVTPLKGGFNYFMSTLPYIPNFNFNKVVVDGLHKDSTNFYFYTFLPYTEALPLFKQAIFDRHERRVAEKKADLELAMCDFELAKAALK